jgi:hypothetical protein
MMKNTSYLLTFVLVALFSKPALSLPGMGGVVKQHSIDTLLKSNIDRSAVALFPSINCTATKAESQAEILNNATNDSERNGVLKKMAACLNVKDSASVQHYYCTLQQQIKDKAFLSRLIAYLGKKYDCGE